MTELGKEYASALFELARENSCEKEFSDALGLIERQFETQPQYAELLSSPDISIGERRKLLEAAFCGKVPEYVMSFTELLCENGRIKLFGECVSEYEKMYRAVSLVSTAKVTSAQGGWRHRPGSFGGRGQFPNNPLAETPFVR